MYALIIVRKEKEKNQKNIFLSRKIFFPSAYDQSSKRKKKMQIRTKIQMKLKKTYICIIHMYHPALQRPAYAYVYICMIHMYVYACVHMYDTYVCIYAYVYAYVYISCIQRPAYAKAYVTTAFTIVFTTAYICIILHTASGIRKGVQARACF